MNQYDDQINNVRDKLLVKLSELSMSGPIKATTRGDNAVGMTLLNALDIDYSSTAKPNYEGIVVSARRTVTSGRSNRVNLFAQVPNWKMSACTSSREILSRHGYATEDGNKRLYCTVQARRPNSQGLLLDVDEQRDVVNELHKNATELSPVAVWELEKLRSRLIEAHPASMWVRAVATTRNSDEYFHYREASFVGSPKAENLGDLISQGTVTLDHLIESKGRSVREKGPLFKINPSNLELLFPVPSKYDLMSHA
jgi:hypothetical protein